MDTAAILRVRVEVENLARENAKLAQFDKNLHAAAASANAAGGGIDKASSAARDLDRDLGKARATVAGVGGDLRRTARDADSAAGALRAGGRAARDLDRDLGATRKTAEDTRAAISSLGGSLQSVRDDLRQAHDAVNDSRGGLQSLRGDLDRARDAALTSGAGIGRGAREGADGVRGLGDESRSTTSDVDGLSDGLRRARQIVADANAQIDRTGAVSGGTRAQLRALASDGVSGLDADLHRMRDTLTKAEDELRKTGSLSRSTVRDLDRLAGGAGGAGGGLSTLSAALAGLPGGFSLLGGAVAVLVVALIGLGGATLAVIAALGPLVGLAAGAAVGVTAAAQAFGVFKLATMGVSAALKEQTTNQTASGRAAITAAEQQRSAARAIQSALDGVRAARQGVRDATHALSEAEYQERQAVQAVAQARRDAAQAIQDARAALVEATNAEERATIGLIDARKALRALQDGPDELTLADARDRVADATRELSRAEFDYGEQIKATNAVLADPGASDADKTRARLDLADAENRVGDARRDLTRATTDLHDIEAGPSRLDLIKARLGVSDAENQVARARADGARAANVLQQLEAAGVNGAKGVLTAQHDLAQATWALEQARLHQSDAEHRVTLALQAVADAEAHAHSGALQAASSALGLNRAMNSLPAPAQAFVRTLIGLKGKLDELRTAAAAGLLPGARAGLLEAARNFVPVRHVVDLTSRALGGLARRAGELVGSSAFGRDIATIGGRNATIVSTLGDAALRLVSAFRHLLVAAGPLTSWLARSTLAWATHVDQTAKAGRESGRTARFFERTREVLRLLGSILLHVGHGLLDIGKVGARSGMGILRSIAAAARRFDDWSQTVAGRRSIQRFFEDSRRLAGALLPVLGGITSGVTNLALRAMPLATVLRLLGPYASQATAAFIGFKVAATIAGLVGGLTGALLAAGRAYGMLAAGTSLATVAQRESAGAAIAAKIAQLAAAGAAKVMAGAQWLLNAAMTANPVLLVVAAVAALVAGVVIAYQKIGWFHKLVDATWDAIKNGVVAAINFVRQHWPVILTILTGPFGLAVTQIIKHWDAIKDFFGELPGRIVDLIKAVPGALTDAGSWVLDRVVEGFKVVTSLFATVGKWYLDTLVGLVQAQLGAWKAAGAWVLDRVVEGFKTVTSVLSGAGHWFLAAVVGYVKGYLTQWKNAGSWVLDRVVEGFKVVTSLLAGAGGWLKDRLVSFVHGTLGALGQLGQWVLNRVVDGFTTVTDALGGVGGWLLRKITGFVHDAKDGLLGLGGWVVDRIVDGLKGGLKAIGGFVNKIIGVINKIPGVDIPQIDLRGLAQGGSFSAAGVQHYATGGEVRRGTVVNAPMIMMGEEAPSWPEFVIPTNPAYRDRAHMLLGQAAKATGLLPGAMGFAIGGVFSSTAYGPPWSGGNGTGTTATGIQLPAGPTGLAGPYIVATDPSVIPMHTALSIWPNPFSWPGVFMAEDTGGAIRGDRLDFLDMIGRAHQNHWGVRNVSVSQTTGTPDDAGIGQGLANAFGGAITGIGGTLGGILSGGAEFLLKQLPNPADMLPDWLLGTGKWAIGKAAGWIKDQVGNIFRGSLDSKASALGRIAHMASFASGLDALDIPYGPQGHSGWEINPAGEDCSSTVSKVLHAGGFLDSVLTTVTLPGALEHGPGEYVTVHDRALAGNAGHTIIQIGDKFFGTSAQNPGGGPGWINVTDSYLSTLPTKLHPTGLARGGILGGLPFGGFFDQGGIVPGRTGEPVAIVAHGGETVTPASGGLAAAIKALGDEIRDLRDGFGVRVYMDGREITDRVEIELDRRARHTGSSYFAGRAG